MTNSICMHNVVKQIAWVKAWQIQFASTISLNKLFDLRHDKFSLQAQYH